MVPTKTLRERVTEALEQKLAEMGFTFSPMDRVDELAEAAIQAIGDPCLIKTADSLEPTFTLRAQDKTADRLVFDWACMAQAAQSGRLGESPSGIPQEKIEEALSWADAAKAWPTRKWPD